MYPYNIAPNYKTNTNIKSMEGDKKNTNNLCYDKRLLELLSLITSEAKCISEYFEKLYKKATDKNDRENLKCIYVDTVKARRFLEDIYYKSVGDKVSYCDDYKKKMTGDYLKDLKKSMMYLSDYARSVRALYVLFQDLEVKDMLFEIITDMLGDVNTVTYMCIER